MMACRKVRYVTRGEARQALKEIDRHRGRGGLRTYRCPACGFWHHGHKRQKGR